MNRRPVAAWAGMIGPALFIALVVLEGWLRPGYDWRSMFVSELSLGTRGWIQIVNFVILGFLLLVFTYGVSAEFPRGKASKAGPALLTIIGISLILSGIFVMDPVSTPPDDMSFHGTLHNLLGAAVFFLMPITCLVFWRRFRAEPGWQNLQWWTVSASIVITIAVAFMVVGMEQLPETQLPDSQGADTQAPDAAGILTAWIGAIQRTALFTFLIWLFTFAYRLLVQARNHPSTVQPS